MIGAAQRHMVLATPIADSHHSHLNSRWRLCPVSHSFLAVCPLSSERFQTLSQWRRGFLASCSWIAFRGSLLRIVAVEPPRRPRFSGPASGGTVVDFLSRRRCAAMVSGRCCTLSAVSCSNASSRTPTQLRHLAVVFAQASEGLVRRLLPPCVFPARQLSASMLMAVLVNQDVRAARSQHDGEMG